MNAASASRFFWVFASGAAVGAFMGYGLAVYTGAPATPPSPEETPVEPAIVQAGDAPAKPPLSGHPNVLIVLWDTVRADRMSLYGAERPTTPWLDRFAEDAVVFDRAYAPSFWTIPTHASIFTGLPVYAHDAYAANTWLQNRFVTMPEHFRDQGYDTWLFSANPNLTQRTNLDQGFEVSHLSSDEPFRSQAIAFHQTKIIAEDASTDRSPAFSGPRGDRNPTDVHKDALPVATGALGRWLDNRTDPERPFFAFINAMEAHTPRLPSMESRKAVQPPDELQLGLTTLAGYKRLSEATRGRAYIPAPQQRAMLGVYDASIRDLDRYTQALMEQLESEGRLDDTVVVIVSDHGEHIGEHDIFGHNFSLYNELIAVPLLVHYPKGLQPRRVNQPVSTQDLFLTLSRLSGLPDPPKAEQLVDLFSDDATSGPVHSELRMYHGWTQGTTLKRPDGSWYPLRRKFRATIDDNQKLVSGSDGSIQLFDLSQDPSEQNNLAEGQPQDVERLQGIQDAWRSQVVLPAADLGKDERQQRKQAEDQTRELREALEALGYVQ